jgi:hypothetical protein
MNTTINTAPGTSRSGSGAIRGRVVRQTTPRLLAGLRLVPAAMLLIGAASFTAPAGATSCHPSNVAISGGTIRNNTTLDLSANGGVAVSNANGGDNNVAVGGTGGPFGNGGNAAAGNGGLANSSASGGMIDLDNVNSGTNSGNTIAVSGVGSCGYGPANLAIDGGTVTNDTNIALSADGGIAVSNANGGDGNVAVGGQGGPFGNGGNAAAGNGGLALADASGGAITVGNINSGNNRGNTILVGRPGAWFGPNANLRINGGTVRNSTNLAISANGGVAVSNANGGDNNVAVGGSGGPFGDGGAAAAGNGGVAIADASGGAVTVGDINSGNNSGNTIVVQGATSGNVAIDGGNVSNETTISISADGGTAVANADGGDGNVAVGGTGGDFGDGGAAAAGNGGVAVSDASGGTVDIGDVNSGGNTGNTIIVGG